MRLHKTVGAIVAAGLAIALPIAMAPAANAAGSVHISYIYYNSPGSDTGSNTSLNSEYVTIYNTTSSSVSLKNWTLTDASRHTYTFGTFTLGPGNKVRVRTGSGTNTSVTRYQNRRAYVWNNTGDTATLRRSSGTVADTCSYGDTGASTKTC